MNVNIPIESIKHIKKIIDKSLEDKEKSTFIKYSNIISTFVKNISLCNNPEYSILIGQLVTKTIKVLQNIYVCAMSADISADQNNNKNELLDIERKYNKELKDIMLIKPIKKSTILGAMSGKNIYSDFCNNITKKINDFYNRLNEDLKTLKYNYEDFLKTCVYEGVDGEPQDYKNMLEDISVQSNKVLNDYYTLYNGYIFYAYMNGVPISKNIIIAIQTIFYFCSSFICTLAKSQIASLFFKLKTTLSKSLGEDELKELNDNIKNTNFIENLISFICNTINLYQNTYKQIKTGNVTLSTITSITQNIDKIIEKRNQVIKFLDQPEPKSKSEIEVFEHKFKKRIERHVISKLPVPVVTRDYIKSGLENPMNQALAVSLASTLNKKGMRQVNHIVNYYNPISTVTKPSVLHKKLWNSDFSSILYKSERQAYIFKPNPRTFLLGSTWIMLTNMSAINEFINQDDMNTKII